MQIIQLRTEFLKASPDIKGLTGFVTAGDFGGTSARLVLYGIDKKGKVSPIIKTKTPSESVKNLADMFDAYYRLLKDKRVSPPHRVVLACAGPIDENETHCKLTNTHMDISTKDLARKGIEAILINDFAANALACPQLDLNNPEQAILIPHKHAAKKKNDEMTMSVLGPGTGLGKAPIYYDKVLKAYYPMPSEGGHTTWAPRNALERYLDAYLRENVTKGRDPNEEAVASGIGLVNILNFFAYGRLPNKKNDERAKLISEVRERKNFQKFVEQEVNADEKQGGGARAIRIAYEKSKFGGVLAYAVDIFVEATAAAARNAGNNFCAYKRIYLAGGNSRRLKDAFLKGNFMEVFDNSYTHTEKLRATEVYVVTSRTLGTDGAAWLAFHPELKRF